MRGIGTQSDPFYVESWEELVTALGTTDAYIECPKNAVWEMNDILPGGITTAIETYAARVNGNGTTIRNLYFSSSYIYGKRSAGTWWYNLNFENVLLESSYGFSSSARFRGCNFSGQLNNGVMFNVGSSDVYIFSHDGKKGCSFNFTLTGKAYMNLNNTKHEYSMIVLDGKSTNANTNVGWWNLKSCYITGKYPFPTLGLTKTSGRNNIFDIFIDENTTVKGNPDYSYDLKNVMNSDKMAGTFDSDEASNDYILATSQQLTDAKWLQEQGFSIIA